MANEPHYGQSPSQISSQYAGFNYPRSDKSHQKSRANGYRPQKENIYPATGYVDPSYIPNATSHYPQPSSVPNVQAHSFHPQQKAYSVTAPRPQPSQEHDRHNNARSKGLTQAPQTASSEHASLLLSLAEEYFDHAYKLSSTPDIVLHKAELREYYNLIAAGLGCLEAVLGKCKLQPEVEATVRLRYATVLLLETENFMEAEEALSKGIDLAARYRIFDLKYNMQHLLVRVLQKTRPPAAMKYLDMSLSDAEAYRHTAWSYAFRFLKVSLHLEVQHETRQDVKAALTTLKAIISAAEKFGDTAVLAVSSVMKALVSLKGFDAEESFEEAQRSLAIVRSLQTNPSISNFAQLNIFTAFADISCHLQQFDPNQALQKMQLLNDALATVPQGQKWMDDGQIHIPLPKERMPQCRRSDGVIRLDHQGSLVLMINWMSKVDLENVGYLLSGMALAHRNCLDGRKSEQILQEGIRREGYAQKQSDLWPKPIQNSVSLKLFRQQVTSHMHLQLAFLLCSRSSSDLAISYLQYLKEIPESWSATPSTLANMIKYLMATYYQSKGHLETALFLYEELSVLKIEHGRILFDIALLATLNSLSIIRHPKHKDHHRIEDVYNHLSKHCARHPNRQIQSAYHLLTATLPLTTTILGTKHSLHSALASAKSTSNNQLMCMVLNIMSWKFFRGVVGAQAEKSARASQNMAKRINDKLWMCVSAGIVWEHLEAAGRMEEAEACWEEGCEMARSLPLEVRKSIKVDEQPSADVEMQDAG